METFYTRLDHYYRFYLYVEVCTDIPLSNSHLLAIHPIHLTITRRILFTHDRLPPKQNMPNKLKHPPAHLILQLRRQQPLPIPHPLLLRPPMHRPLRHRKLRTTRRPNPLRNLRPGLCKNFVPRLLKMML